MWLPFEKKTILDQPGLDYVCSERTWMLKVMLNQPHILWELPQEMKVQTNTKIKIPNVATVWDNISEQVQIQPFKVQTFIQSSEVTVTVFKCLFHPTPVLLYNAAHRVVLVPLQAPVLSQIGAFLSHSCNFSPVSCSHAHSCAYQIISVAKKKHHIHLCQTKRVIGKWSTVPQTQLVPREIETQKAAESSHKAL